MRKEDCRPGMKVRVLANHIFAKSPNSEDFLKQGDIVEIINNAGYCRFFSHNSHEDSVYFIRPGKSSNFILISDIEPFIEASEEQPTIQECKCDLWKGCTCGVFAAEMKNKRTD